MPEFVWVMLYAMLPVIGHGLGASIAVSTRPPRWIVGAALHGSAGIAIGLISMDLMPRIEGSVPIWLMMVMFLVGAGVSVALATAVSSLRAGHSEGRTGAIMAYAAVAADLFSDGLMTGAGSAVESRLGLLLAAAQAVANIPGGFAVTANLSSKENSKIWRLGLAASMAIPVLGSAVLGLVLLSGASDLVQHSALMVIVGLLLLTTVEDIIPEGDAPRPPRWISTTAFTLGFIGLVLSSHYLR